MYLTTTSRSHNERQQRGLTHWPERIVCQSPANVGSVAEKILVPYICKLNQWLNDSLGNMHPPDSEGSSFPMSLNSWVNFQTADIFFDFYFNCKDITRICTQWWHFFIYLHCYLHHSLVFRVFFCVSYVSYFAFFSMELLWSWEYDCSAVRNNRVLVNYGKWSIKTPCFVLSTSSLLLLSDSHQMRGQTTGPSLGLYGINTRVILLA